MIKGMNNRNCLMGCGAAGVVVAIFLVVGAALAYSMAPKAGGIQTNLAPVIVNITFPLNNTDQTLNQPASVIAEAFSEEPIKDLELTINGQLFTNRVSASPSGGNYMNSQWYWMPDREDTFTLTVRAISMDGQTSISNVVNVRVVPEAKASQVVPVEEATTPQNAPTPDPTAQAELFASIVSSGPIQPPAGFNDQGIIPVPPPPATQDDPNPGEPEEPKQQPGNNPPSFIVISIQSLFQKWGLLEKTSAPKLDGGAKKCKAVLIIQDTAENEAGFNLYRSDPPSGFFSKIATLDGKTGASTFSYQDPGLSTGIHSYYVSAFNAEGEAPSNIIAINITDPDCNAANPPQLGPDKIIVDIGQKLDKLYCYGMASQMPWVRLPAGQDNFIYPVNDEYDLAPYWKQIPLPNPAPPKYSLYLECWGWSGSSLVFLGTESKKIDTTKKEFIIVEPLIGQVLEPTQKLMDGEMKEIAPPYNLHYTDNIKDCGIHETDSTIKNWATAYCEFELKKGKNILVFDWAPGYNCDPNKPSECPYDFNQELSGFEVHQSTGDPQTKMIADLKKGSHYFLVAPWDGQGSQPEYYVRAYYKTPEIYKFSDKSNIAQGKAGAITVKLTNPTVQTYWSPPRTEALDKNYGIEWYLVNSDTTVYPVGWHYIQHDDGKRLWFHFYKNIIFPHEQMTQVKGEVINADILWKQYQNDEITDESPCASFKYNNLITIGEGPLHMNGDYDVTAIVREIVNAGHYANQNMETGFYLWPGKLGVAPQESQPYVHTCFQYYYQFEMDVTYVPW